MNVIICDDELACTETFRLAVSEWAEAHKAGDVITVTVFHTGEELMEGFESGLRMDALFINIQFRNEDSGLRMIKHICLLNPAISIVFITGKNGDNYEGDTGDALRFIRKPVSQADIHECMEVIWYQYCKVQHDLVIIETKTQVLRLPADAILYVEALGHMVSIKTTDQIGKYTVRKPFHEIHNLLPPKFFARCHRSYIVNLHHARRFTRQELILSNGDRIPVGRTFQAECRRLFLEYWLGGNVS